MPRKKTTITLTEHQNRMKNVQEQNTALLEQINQRDKLISFMQQENRRGANTNEEHSKTVTAMVTFIDSFNANWTQFRGVVLGATQEKIEFDAKTMENAFNISQMINSLYTADNATPYNPFALTNSATNIINNALLNIDAGAAAGTELNYNLATGTVTLLTLPVLGTSHAQLLAAGSTSIRVSHDINGKARTAPTVDIGPEEFSAVTTSTNGRAYSANPDVAFNFGI